MDAVDFTPGADVILACLLRGGSMPANLRFRLTVGDPRLDGWTELDYPGYAAQLLSTSTGWAVPDGGAIARTSAAGFPTPTGESTDAASHWLLDDPDTGDGYFVGLLGELDIDFDPDNPPTTGPLVLPRVRVADALTFSD